MMFHGISSSNKNSQSGNVFFALFGAVALVGVVGATSMQVMKGPVRSMSEVTKRTVAENNMIASSKLALLAATTQANDGDCDADNFIEPIPFENAGASPKPTGGGYLPATIGAAINDPWDTRYGYCVWDHGATTAGCGGGNYLTGENSNTGYAIAIISAGPDRTFNTTCSAYPSATALNKAPGSDDVVLGYTYAEAEANSGGLWNLKSGDPNTAQIGRDLEVTDSGGNVTFALDADTGIGDFIGLTVGSIAGRGSDPVDITGPLLLESTGIAVTGACTNTDAFAFDTTTDQLVRCNGTNWVAIGGSDNLGNHIAAQNIQLGSHWLSGDGGSEGMQVNATGTVSTSGALTTGTTLAVGTNATVGGTLGVTGATTLSTLGTSGLATLNTLSVANNAGVNGTLDVNGSATMEDLTISPVSAVGNAFNVLSSTSTSLLRVSKGGGIYLGAGVASNDATGAGGISIGGGGAYNSGGNINIYGPSHATRPNHILFRQGLTEVFSLDSAGNVVVYNTLDMTGGKIINLLDPTAAQDAASKAYVDARVAAGTGFVEADPQVSTLTPTKWCVANAGGTAIECTASTPAGAADNLGDHVATQNIVLGTNYLSGDGGNEGIYVGSTGNVGIGLSAPSAKLHIASSAGVGIESTALALGTNDWGGNTATTIQFRQDMDATNSTVAAIAAVTEVGNTKGQLQFRTANPFDGADLDATDTRMTITSEGNVGIGTNSPDVQLNIENATGGDATFRTRKTGGSDFYISSAATSTSIGTAGATDIDIRSNNQQRVKILSNGNIGIGTTAPNEKLSISNGSTSSGTVGLYEDSDNGTNRAILTVPAALAANYTLTLPVDDGTAGQILTTDGSGILSWTTGSGGGDNLGAGGTTTGTLYSNNSGFGYVGTSASNYVRFDDTATGTPNRANFYLGGAWEYEFRTTYFAPFTTNANDLGTTTLRWKDGWFAGTVTAGTFAGSGASLTSLNASNLASGTVPTARLGTGTADATTYLRGDGTWVAPPSGADNLGNHIATTVLRSDTNNTDDLGTTAIRWKDGWFAGTVTGGTFAGSGASLTNLSASNLASGTVAAARMPALTGDVTMTAGTTVTSIAANAVDSAEIAAGAVDLTHMSATGTKNATTYLRGDNTWATPSGSDNLGNHIATTVLRSDTNNTDDLGTTAIRWKDGWFAGNVTAAAYLHSSDERLKSDIKTVQDPIAIINQLRGVHYVWKSNQEPAYGLIAQEVEKVMPDAVATDTSGMKAVEYDQIIAPLIEAVKAQQAQIEEMKADLSALKATKAE